MSNKDDLEPEETDEAIKAYEKEKARFEAEKARLEAEKARHDAQKALNESETAAAVGKLEKEKALADAEKALLESNRSLASTQKLAELQNQKEMADAVKARHDAQKAQNESETAAAVGKLEKEKALADAEKALLESNRSLASNQKLAELKNQKEMAAAEKALADSLKELELTKSPAGQQLTQLEQQKKLADAQKLLVDSQTQAALAAHIGPTKAGAFSGSVEMKDKAGFVESKLLAADAVKTAAKEIADDVEDKARKFYIFKTEAFPGFQNLMALRFQVGLIQRAYRAAKVEKPVRVQSADAATKAGPEQQVKAEPKSVPVMAGLSAGLEAFSNILGHLKTDFTIQGVDVSLEDAILTRSVAGALSEDTGNAVFMPSLHVAAHREETTQVLTREFGDCDVLRRLASDIVDELQTEIQSLTAEAEGKSEDEKQELLGDLQTKKTSLKQLTEVNESYDKLLSSLVTADDAGNLPISILLQEISLEQALQSAGDDGAVLLLNIETSGGGYLLKKNILTGLGTTPLWHMGGATVTYLLLKGNTGQVLAGNVLPVHGGFIQSGYVRRRLRRSRRWWWFWF